MPEQQEHEAPSSCWSTEHWRQHCEGFQAWSDDVLIGYVDTVLLDDDGRAHSLIVRVGEIFNHLVAIPADAVTAVDPAAERVEVASVATVRGAQLAIPIVV